MQRRQFLKLASVPVIAFGGGWRVIQAVGMRVYCQWAQSSPSDWVALDTGNWPNRQTKPDPVGDVSLNGLGEPIATGDALLNNQAGWVFGLNCQGVMFGTHDHVAVEPHSSGGVVITRWDDDPFWYPNGAWQFADVWTFEPLAFDPKIGAINTKQSRIFYGDSLWLDWYQMNNGGVLPPYVHPLAEWTAPDVAVTKHGIWLSDTTVAQHEAVQGRHGWREWGT